MDKGTIIFGSITWGHRFAYIGLLAVCLIMFFCALGIPPVRVGDGSEYYALFLAWQDTWRPWMTSASFHAYDQFYALREITGLVPRRFLEEAFPALRLGGTADFNHFWGYSLAAYVIAKFSSLFGLTIGPHASFLALHFAVLFVCVVVAYRLFGWRGVIAVLLMTIGSPMLWFANKVHTEFLTYCLVLSAVMLVYAKRYLPGALFLALASAQNPSFALIAFVPLIYRLALVKSWTFRISECVLILATVITVFLHPVYYFFRFGVVTPQLLAGGASAGANLRQFYIWLVDPDLGLLPNWYLGVALILVGIVMMRHVKHNVAPFGDRWFYLFVAISLLVNFYAQSSTTNLNSGATPGLARYALWYLPLFFPLVFFVVSNISTEKAYLYPLLAGLAGLVFFSCIANNPRRGESYSVPTTLSRFIQTEVPWLYTPPTEVFAERYSERGEAIHSFLPRGVLGPDCRKLLLYPGNERTLVTHPRHCQYNGPLLERLAGELAAGAKKELFTRLDDEKTRALQLVVNPGEYVVAESGNGNFILGSGWSIPEPWGVWSQANVMKLTLPCNSRQFYFGRDEVNITLHLQPFGTQEIKVSHLGKKMFASVLSKAEAITFPLKIYQCQHGPMDFLISVEAPRSPAELGQSSDTRKLGVALLKFRVD